MENEQNDMETPERFEFHDWFKDKYGEEYPHPFSVMYRILVGKVNKEMRYELETLVIEFYKEKLVRPMSKHTYKPTLPMVKKIEDAILDKTAEIYKMFSELEQTHPSDINDLVDAIQNIQKVISIRTARRVRPDKFVTIKK